MFSTLSKTKLIILSTPILSSANAFNMDQSKILPFGKELKGLLSVLISVKYFFFFSGVITVQNPDPIDYEVTSSMRLIVAAVISDVYAYTTVWVNLIDINDNKPVFSQDRYITKVYEEQPKNTYVMQVLLIMFYGNFICVIFQLDSFY